MADPRDFVSVVVDSLALIASDFLEEKHRSMNRTIAIFLLSVAISIGGGVLAVAGDGFDVLLKGGRVVDGTGAPWYVADIAVRDGKIIGIGRLDHLPAERVVDVTGLYVAPGFIDMMGQTGAPFLKNPQAADNLLTQGITTINAGEGQSDAPLDAEARGDRRLDDHERILHRARKGRDASQHGANRRAHPGAPDRPW